MTTRRAMTCALAMVAMAASQNLAHAGLIVYGLTTAGRIDAIDVAGQTDTIVTTGSGLGTTNGLAIDTADKVLIFGSTTSGSGLEIYSLSTNTFTSVVGASLPGTISNGAFYGGSYYYVEDKTDLLEKVSFLAGTLASNAPTISSVTSITLTGSSPNTIAFGDIAITTTGTLYGSTSTGIFSLNLNSSTSTGTNTASNASYAPINGSTPQSYQIALDPTQSFLYAEQDTTNNAANGGTWGTIALNGTNKGMFVATAGFTTFGFGDIADQALVTPEPSTVVMLGMAGLSGMVGLVRKRRKVLAG